MIIKNCNGGRFTYKSGHFVVESGQIELIERRWGRAKVFEKTKRNERSKIGKFGVFFNYWQIFTYKKRLKSMPEFEMKTNRLSRIDSRNSKGERVG